MAREIVVTTDNLIEAKRAKQRQSVTKRPTWSCEACGITGTDDVDKCPRCHDPVGPPPASLWSDRDLKVYDQAKANIAAPLCPQGGSQSRSASLLPVHDVPDQQPQEPCHRGR